MINHHIRNTLLSLVLLPLSAGLAAAAELAAQLDWSAKQVLSTPVTGVVEQVRVVPGQKFKKGELLLNLDAREFQAARNQAAARRLAAKTTLDEAGRELERAQDLYDRTMLAEHELQVVKNSEAHAKAAYLGAQALLQQTEIALERSRIQAPYDGVVLSVQVQPGQTVLSQLQVMPLAVVAQADKMVARAWLDAADLDKYAGVSATQVSVAGRQYAVVSQHIVYEANDKGLYALEVVFDSAGASLHPGMAANIILP
ncbi:MAG: efflux RND transporter periplasmic adaptor subunit [Gammaproteobacteria bacterium]